jgi:hypothetical protein
MFNLYFDRCLVPFHAILTEITVFKPTSFPGLQRELAEKALLKPFTIFSRLLSQLVGWFDEVSCSVFTLCWDKSPHERVFPIDWDKSMCASNEAQFERAS